MRPPQAGLVKAITLALAADIGIQVADTVATFAIPPAPVGGLIPGWIIVHSIAGGSYAATLANPHRYSDIVIQLDCLAVTVEQAEWVADRAGVCLLDRAGAGWRVALAAPGVVAYGRKALQPGGVQSSAERARPLFWKSERYELSLCPSA